VTTVERLLLGGPRHGRRVAVDEDDQHLTVPSTLHVGYWRANDDLTLAESSVTYTLRRVPGTAERVFVAPDYGYDTPEWLAFDTESWAAAMVPGMVGWEHLGPWRWRARQPEDSPGWMRYCWLYVLLADRGDGFVKQFVTDELVEDMVADANDRIFGDMQHEIDHHRLPLCVVPGCTEKAPMVFWADEAGRLAGRAWRKGDEIRLCPPHGSDLYRAAGAPGVDQLAEWLRPDAKVDGSGPWERLAARHWGADSQTRSLRVSIPMREAT
jgi:hypothetical protein